MLENNLLNTNNNFSDMKLEIHMIQGYDVNFILEDQYKYNFSDEAFVFSKDTNIATISAEALVRGLCETIFTMSFEVQINEMRNILFHAYTLNSVEEVKASEYSKLLADVLHGNRLYFLSETVALELVKYHKERNFDTWAIISADKTVNKDFIAFAVEVINSVLENINSALFGSSSDSMSETCNGILSIKPLISSQEGVYDCEDFIEDDDITGESVKMGTLIWYRGYFHVNIVLDLDKLYDYVGDKDFIEAILHLLVALNYVTPKIRKNDEVCSVGYYYQNAVIRKGLATEIDLSDDINNHALGSTSFFIKAIKKSIQDAERKLSNSSHKYAEFELGVGENQTLSNLIIEILHGVKLLAS